LYLNGKFYSIMSAPAWLPHNFSSAIAPKGLPNNGGEYFLKETSYFLTCFFKISISQLFVPIGTLIIECILDLIGTSITNKYFVLKIVLTCPCWNKLSEQFSNKIKKYHFLHLPFNNKYENWMSWKRWCTKMRILLNKKFLYICGLVGKDLQQRT
jgi:hypothetical protein